MILLLVIGVVQCRFMITSPESFAAKYPKITYSMANFGHFPYGHTQSGLLVLPPSSADGYDMCSSVNSTSPQAAQYWLVVRRGNCTFTKKAKNAQAAGANMLIIVDNVQELSQQIIMGDDGNGYSVTIPAIFIGKGEGDAIIEELERLANRSSMIAVATFDDTKKQEVPFVLFGLSIENRQTFKLLSEFKPYYEQFRGKVKFGIYYELIPCYLCRFKLYSSEESNCLGGGRYCSIDPDGGGVGSGQNVVYEELRQHCLFLENPDLWWEYMYAFDTECLKPQEFDSCSKRLLNNETLHQRIGHCVASSFDPGATNQKLALNSVLEDWSSLRANTGIVYYPGATVNNITYRGGLFAESLAEDICSGMLTPAPVCQQQKLVNPFVPNNKNDETSYGWLIGLVLASCLVFALFMILVYRRMLRRELSIEMGQQVNQMVSQYISFYEDKSTRTS